MNVYRADDSGSNLPIKKKKKNLTIHMRFINRHNDLLSIDKDDHFRINRKLMELLLSFAGIEQY